MNKAEPVPEHNPLMRTSVFFDYHTHRVEYGAIRLSGAVPHPFVSVDGVDIALTPELRHGWAMQDFGKAVLAYMKLNYPDPQK